MAKKKPQRLKKRNRTNHSGSHPSSRTNSPAPQPEKEHINPWLVAAILIPMIGGLIYIATGLFNPPTAPELAGNGDSDAPTDVQTSSDIDPVEVEWKTADSQRENWDAIDDATVDGWDTEAFTDKATEQFAKLKKLLQKPETITADSVASFADEQINVSHLRPTELETVFADQTVVVKRAGQSTGTSVQKQEPIGQGRQVMADALQKFSQPFSDAENLRLKIKVFRVEKLDGEIRTLQTVEVFGQSDQGLVEENSVWQAIWNNDGDQPKLKNLVVTDYESASRDSQQTLFSDCTESVIGQQKRFQEQLNVSFNHWLNQAQVQEFYSLPSNAGLAIGDVNNDGLEDVYVCQEVGLPNMLYLQQPDGSLQDHSAESQADWIENSRFGLIIDWDNDGNNDLAVAVTGGVVLAKGDGTGRFDIQEVLDTREDPLALSAADFNLDGKTDLFVGVYFPNQTDGSARDVPISSEGGAIDSNMGGRNSLYRNETVDGNWQFADVTETSGIDTNNQRYSQAASWADYDNDGDPDLYVANDFGQNNLYRNDRQTDGTSKFVDVALEMAVTDQAAGMSAAWGDYDRDGWMDLYVSNMYSYAGNRIAFQSNFKPDESSDVKERFQRFARGNTFFQNSGSGKAFNDISIDLGVNRGRWGWGSRFMDLNNDGWQDLVAGNGYITTEDSGDL